MKKFLFLIILGVTFLLSSCGGEDELDNSVIMPLKVGNKWVYETKVYDNGEAVETKYDTNEVVGTLEYGGVTWFRYKEFDFEFFVRNTEKGQEELILDTLGSGKIKSSTQVFYQYPVEKDLFYKVNEGRSSLTVDKDKKKIKSPNGKYECYEYIMTEFDFDDYVSNYFMKPGLGVVKLELRIDGSLEVSELVSYELK